jgi:hypothetical protein
LLAAGVAAAGRILPLTAVLVLLLPVLPFCIFPLALLLVPLERVEGFLVLFTEEETLLVEGKKRVLIDTDLGMLGDIGEVGEGVLLDPFKVGIPLAPLDRLPLLLPLLLLINLLLLREGVRVVGRPQLDNALSGTPAESIFWID